MHGKPTLVGVFRVVHEETALEEELGKVFKMASSVRKVAARWVCICCAILCYCNFVVEASEFEKAPRLVVYKKAHGPVVVGTASVINYFVVNSGDASAMNVRVEDFYSPGVFSGIEGGNLHANGTMLFYIPELGVGKDFSFNTTMVARVEGVYTPPRAEVEYYNGAVTLEHDEEFDEEDMLFGYSSTPGKLYIMTEEEYLSNSTMQLHEVLAFLVLGGLSVLAPAAAWKNAPPSLHISKKK